MDADDIGVGELVLAVRRELASLDAQQRAEGMPTLFALEHLELDISFEAVKRREGHAGIDLKVVSVGGAKSAESTETHRVHIRYTVDEAARRANVPGSRAHGLSAGLSTPAIEPLE